MRSADREWLIAGLALTLVIGAVAAEQSPEGRVAASQPSSRPGRPAEADIRNAIRQLTHPVHSRRRAAIRKLAEWGPWAFPELRRAAAGGNLETAISARDLLAELEAAPLVGSDVRLLVDRPRLAWDQPLMLTIVAQNPTVGPIRVPWTHPPAATQPISDPEQVARMMDVADFLVVSGPDGESVDLRVEPIDQDPAVYREVDVRAKRTGPLQEVAPGGAARLELPLFNRGWARFPLLKAGRYSIKLEYQPEWKDPSWTREGFGRVRSLPVSVEIKPAAVPEIAGSRAALAIQVRPAGEWWEAILCSRWDIPLWVNLNVNGPKNTHARLEWRLRNEDGEALKLAAPEGKPVFQAERLIRLEPGENRVIDRFKAAEIEKHRSEIKGHAEVNVRYVNLIGRVSLHDELSRLGHAAKVPPRLFTGVISSETQPADEVDQ